MSISQISGPAVAINGGVSLGAALTIGTNDAQALIFETNGTERARFTSTGELIVVGPIVTINSTVVDITDRVFTVNKSAGANDPVPSLMTGLSVYRGAVSGVARDKATVIWDEPNSRWNFALNTGGDELAIGADQSVKLATLLASADLKMLTNDKSLFGRNAANSADVEIARIDSSDRVSIAQGGADMLLGGGAITWTGASNKALALTASGTGTVGIQSATGTISIGTTGSARTVSIGTGAAAQTVNVGSTDSTSKLTLEAGSSGIDIGVSASTRTINVGTGATNAQTINIGTGAAANAITIGTTNTTAATTITAGTGYINLTQRTNVKAAAGLYVTDAGGSNGVYILQQAAATHTLGSIGTTTTLRVLPTLEMDDNITILTDKAFGIGTTAKRFNGIVTQTATVKNHDAFASSEHVTTTAAVQTTNSTTTTIFTLAVPDNSGVWCEVHVVGRDTGGSTRGMFARRFLTQRNAGGSASSTAQTLGSDVNTGGWGGVSIADSGNNTLIRVAGASATINWACTVRYQAVIDNT